MKLEYKIMWRGEEVDSTEDYKEAQYLIQEYNLAYGEGCSIKRVKI